MRHNDHYKIYIRPPIGSNTIVCDSKENVGIALKKEYDKFKSNSLRIVGDVEQYKLDPVQSFINHVQIKESR